MILGEMFPSDSIKLAEIQFEAYGSSLWTIFKSARDKYLWAESILGIRTELGEKIKLIDKIDHRTLQWLHDAIAGKFRLNFLSNKLDLFDNSRINTNIDVEIDFLIQWQNFLSTELDNIFLEDPKLVKNICIAVAFKNPDKLGCQAEHNIYRFTLLRYESLLVKKQNS